MLRGIVLGGVAALGMLVQPTGPAEAGKRLYCLCNGKETSRIHHNHACEIHFKRTFARTAKGFNKPVSPCTVEEWSQFRAYLCVADRCTYPYIGSSTIKVPLDN